uniref:Uncharacterized protein n=1 Tax=Daphnia galeata TaxID=27404 RepID=A0A8J2RTG6_9CRUS|nr:unnamed protein product [Daphnia galeata]
MSDDFDNADNRLKDFKGEPMLLKLMDWLSNNDFTNLSKHHVDDFINALPMQQDRHLNWRLYLADRLPGDHAKYDLGPKMYIAYGMAETNLHFERCDVVNVMAYVGELHNHANEAIQDSECDNSTRKKLKKVRYFQSCLNVASDFVSLETVGHCLKLKEEVHWSSS